MTIEKVAQLWYLGLQFGLVEVLIFPLQTLHFKHPLAVNWLLAGDQDCDPTKRTVVQVLNW